jgi:hypothetical protein
LRWCVTCAARLSDARLIGTAIRIAPARWGARTRRLLSTMRSAVVARVGSEREASLAQRLRDAFDDRRLLWPALGGTLALAFGLALALTVLRVTTDERPESLAAMLGTLSTPGSERNPLTPATAPSFGGRWSWASGSRTARAWAYRFLVSRRCRALRGARERRADYLESEYTVAAVVNREGRVSNYAVLRSSQRSGGAAAERGAVQDAVRLSRFEPAQTPTGEAVAVNLIWVIVHQR